LLALHGSDVGVTKKDDAINETAFKVVMADKSRNPCIVVNALTVAELYPPYRLLLTGG